MKNRDKKKNILVIDDIESNIEFINDILEDIYNISSSTNPLDGFDIIKKMTPDLILLDIEMPQMNGFEFAQKLKESESTKSIPIIFLSSFSNKKVIEKALSLGAYDYIEKPFNRKDLIKSVSIHINIQKKTDKLFIKDSLNDTSILIVEDNEDMYEKFHEYLEHIFSNIFYASDFSSAYEIVLNYKPKIILIDNHIQNIDTHNFTRKISMHDSNIIITQMSEVSNPDIILNFMRNGVRDVLKKPISWIDMKSALLRYERIINKIDVEIIDSEVSYSISEIRNIFSSLIKNHNSKITLTNNYKGIPIIKECEIVDILAKEVLIKIDKQQINIIELSQSTILSSIYSTKNIQARLKEIDYSKSIATFDNFVYLGARIQNRKNIRIEPDNSFYMYLIFDKKAKKCDIFNISDNYALIKLFDIPENFKQNCNVQIEVRFYLLGKGRKKISIRHELRSRISFVSRIFKNNDEVITLIYFEFNEEDQAAFNKYIYQRGVELIIEYKKKLNL